MKDYNLTLRNLRASHTLSRKHCKKIRDLREFFFVPFFPSLSLGSSWQGGNGREKERESAWENGGSAVLNTNLEYLCVIRALR